MNNFKLQYLAKYIFENKCKVFEMKQAMCKKYMHLYSLNVLGFFVIYLYFFHDQFFKSVM